MPLLTPGAAFHPVAPDVARSQRALPDCGRAVFISYSACRLRSVNLEQRLI